MVLIQASAEILSKQIRVPGVDEQLYDSAEAFVEATIDILTEDANALDILEELRAHTDYILAHSIGVSLYSLMIAQEVNWTLPTNKFKVALAALLHDLGMKELNRDMISKPRYSWTEEEVKSFEGHPLKSLAVLGNVSGISEDVFEVIKQHHESCSSYGFPMGIKSPSIHPMAKLISVADEFCYRVIKNPFHDEMTPSKALQDMAMKCSEQLDKKFFRALNQLFKKSETRPLRTS